MPRTKTSIEARFPWSVCVMPNAAGWPHIGHLWSVAHSRMIYEFVRDRVAEFENDYEPTPDAAPRWISNEHCLDMQWNVFFEATGFEACRGAWLRMLDWMGYPPDRVDKGEDWLAIAEHRDTQHRASSIVGLVAGLPGEMAPGGTHRIMRETDSYLPVLHKILYWNATHTYWHMRGIEIKASGIAAVEHAVQQFVAPLFLPRFLYHPLLADEETGAKISSGPSGEASGRPEYRIDDDVMAHDPEHVLITIMKLIGARTNPPVHPNCPKRIIQQIFQQYPGGPVGESSHRMLWGDKSYKVPLDWRKHL